MNALFKAIVQWVNTQSIPVLSLIYSASIVGGIAGSWILAKSIFLYVVYMWGRDVAVFSAIVAMVWVVIASVLAITNSERMNK